MLYIELPTKKWAILLFILNLTLGVTFCFVVFPRLVDTTSGLDPDGYGQSGMELYQTGRFDSVSQAPLYPAFVAVVSRLVGGYKVAAVQSAQCLLLAFSCAVFYTIFRLTLGDGCMARVAGLACAIYPMSIWYVPRLWTETFLILMLALFTLALVNLLQKPSWIRAVLCGILSGVLALNKGITLVFLPLTIIILAVFFSRTSLRWILWFGGAALLLIAPWTWRNWEKTGYFLPIHAGAGYNFYLGNGFTRHWNESPFSYSVLKALTEEDLPKLNFASENITPVEQVQQDNSFLMAGVQEIVEDPPFLLRKFLVQGLTFWYLAADFSKSMMSGVLQFPLVLLAVVGVIRAVRKRSWAMILMIPVAGIMGVSIWVLAFARLSSTIMPYMIGLAIYGLWPITQSPIKNLKPE
jgi:4-amino-4-deoxy-L-arabinose transferase-like glycosyltransferase